MQEIRSANPPVVTGICDPNNSRARHHHSLKLGSKLKYLNLMTAIDSTYDECTMCIVIEGYIYILTIKMLIKEKTRNCLILTVLKKHFRNLEGRDLNLLGKKYIVW